MILQWPYSPNICIGTIIVPLSPTIHWHTAVLVCHDRHFYIFSDHFDPSLYLSPQLNKPRLRNQKGIIQIYHLLSVFGLKNPSLVHQ